MVYKWKIHVFERSYKNKQVNLIFNHLMNQTNGLIQII